MSTIGVDLGGTKVGMVLLDESGRVLKSHRYATRSEDGPDQVIAGIAEQASELRRGAAEHVQALGVGVGVAGQVEKETGAVSFAPNLGWTNVALRESLEEALMVPVAVTNDVRAVTWGEWQYGAGRGVDDLVCVFIGTGVGGGIVAGGRMMEGFNNSAGELGHITIVSGGRDCNCPNRGCLEAYVGGRYIGERAREAVDADPQAGSRLVALAGGADRISSATVSKAYDEGDRLARHLVNETSRYLADGLISIVNAFNPSLLILGGGVTEGIPDLASLTEPAVRARALPAAVESLRVVNGALGEEAGAIGAAALARKTQGEAER